jgi:heterodisulfide reductase subunit C
MVEKMSETKESHREYKTDEDFDKNYFKDIERKTNIWQCIQCGSCTASCESGNPKSSAWRFIGA